MPEMVTLHESIKEIWEQDIESCIHPVKDQIIMMQLMDTYVSAQVSKLLQLHHIVHLNEENEL